jgi:hypothetical protein
MRSATEVGSSGRDPVNRTFAASIEIWNRKLHYYTGLYLLLFVWLFAFTGLLLNHQWKFADFWPTRQQTAYERPITSLSAAGDLEQAREILSQLQITGEIEWTTTRADPGKFDFRASRPGHIFEIRSDLAQNRVRVQRIDLNAWGVMHILHTFIGVRTGDRRNHRDWLLTSIWAFTMDAVAAGLILMVISSLYMWYRLVHKRVAGMCALVVGILSCGLFCVGLRWVFP